MGVGQEGKHITKILRTPLECICSSWLLVNNVGGCQKTLCAIASIDLAKSDPTVQTDYLKLFYLLICHTVNAFILYCLTRKGLSDLL